MLSEDNYVPTTDSGIISSDYAAVQTEHISPLQTVDSSALACFWEYIYSSKPQTASIFI